MVAARRIGTYEVEGLLGEGGIAQVFAARDMVLGRRVAIKILRPELAHNRDFVDRFHVEAKSLGNLTHPNITTIHAFLTDAPDVPMVMELVDGETIGAIIARERHLDLRYATAVLAQTIAGLGYAHRAGVVHRDIKPANLMVTRGGIVKIMDFGIAKIPGSNLTRTGIFQGTLSYASPEQIRSEVVGPQSDQYSLAVVFYQMIAGEAPFKADSEYGLMTAHLRDDPPPLPDWVPPVTSDAVMRALAKRPEDRFASVEEFGRAAGSAAVRGEAIDILQQGPTAAPAAKAEEPTRIIQRGSVRQLDAPPAAAKTSAEIEPALAPAPEHNPARRIPTIGHNEPSVSFTAGHVAQPQELAPLEAISVEAPPPHPRASRLRLAIGATAAVGVVAAVGLLTLRGPAGVSAMGTTPSAAPAPPQSFGSAATAPDQPPDSPTNAPPSATTSKVAAAVSEPPAANPAPPAIGPQVSPSETREAPTGPAAISASSTPPQAVQGEAAAASVSNPPAEAKQEAVAPVSQPDGKSTQPRQQASLPPTPAVESSLPASPAQSGDDSTWTDDQRREAQSDLIAMGNLKSGADGNFGPATRAAIRQLQSFLGDPETGAMTDVERQTLHDMAQGLSALLTRGDISPAGVVASSVRGAAARHQRAQTAMRGSNGAPDPAEAVYWDGLAASDGDAGAATDLGTMLVRGRGVPKPDPQGAMLMWWAAAARGEPIAMFNLGALWELGRGVSPDLEKAKAWYRLAAAHNYAAAQAALKRLGA